MVRSSVSSLRRLSCALASFALVAACAEPDGDGPFVPFPFGGSADRTTDRLCTHAADPDADPDPLHPECRVEGEASAPDESTPGTTLRVLAYNLERGYELDAQLAWLASPDAPRPDLVILTEADRGCSRTGGRHVAREWAQALAMDYVYAVEFQEVRFDAMGGVAEACEHGNAILARAPLGNVRILRFEATDDWTTSPAARTYPTETRFGGRVAIRAELELRGRRLRVYGAHLASGAVENEIRGAEAQEILADAEGTRMPMLVVGDLNTHLYGFDLDLMAQVEAVTQSFFAAGFVDSHATLPRAERATDLEYGLIIDLALGRGVRFEDPWIGDPAVLGSLSDHLPIATTVRF